jgi:hypothetical protein
VRDNDSTRKNQLTGFGSETEVVGRASKVTQVDIFAVVGKLPVPTLSCRVVAFLAGSERELGQGGTYTVAGVPLAVRSATVRQ